MDIAVIMDAWVNLSGNTRRGIPCINKSRYYMKVLPGGCLKYLCAFYLRVVLFSLPVLGGFCSGCPCVPCWVWSSPVGDGEDDDRCVRELGIYQWYWWGNIFVGC